MSSLQICFEILKNLNHVNHAPVRGRYGREGFDDWEAVKEKQRDMFIRKVFWIQVWGSIEWKELFGKRGWNAREAFATEEWKGKRKQWFAVPDCSTRVAAIERYNSWKSSWSKRAETKAYWCSTRK